MQYCKNSFEKINFNNLSHDLSRNDFCNKHQQWKKNSCVLLKKSVEYNNISITNNENTIYSYSYDTLWIDYDGLGYLPQAIQ